MYPAQAMAGVQIMEHGKLNWNHFEREIHLHLGMNTKFLPHVSVLIAALILTWYFDTFDFGFFTYTSKKRGDAVDELLKKKHQIIGKECIPETNTCFLIVDSYYLENGKLTTKRDLLLEEHTDYSLTGVEIESNKPVTWENLDSRNWSVNKVVINARYARLLVASGFIMESLTFDENEHQDILIAGLGGGVMSNFLSEIAYLNLDTTVIENEESIIHLAENYFDHFETNEMRVIHADVVDHLQKYNKKYDHIIVDACENKLAEVMCPVSKILEKEIVQLLKKRLTLNGSVAVNVYVTQDVGKTEKKILELFSNEFNSCFFLEYFKDKKLLEAIIRLIWGREQVQNPDFLRAVRFNLIVGIDDLQVQVDMLNQHNNQGAQPLINVQRPHQIQPPGQHRMVQQGQGMPNQMQQNQNQLQPGQMQQGNQMQHSNQVQHQNQMQPVQMQQQNQRQHQNQMQQPPMQQGNQQNNMGQPQMTNMQSQRQVGQPGPSSQSINQQQQQGQMMNMGGQQMRSNQQQPQQQMMQNTPQQQMRGNSQQQQMRTPQGSQMQSQPPQTSQIRMQQNQNQQNMNMPQQRTVIPQNQHQNQQNMQQHQHQSPHQNQNQQHMHQNQQNMQQDQHHHQQNQQGMRMAPQQQRMQPQQHMQMQQGGQQNMNRPSPQQQNMNMNQQAQQHHQMQQGSSQVINNRSSNQQIQHGIPQGISIPSQINAPSGAPPNMNQLPSQPQQANRPLSLQEIMARPPLKLPEGEIVVNLNARPQIRILPVQQPGQQQQQPMQQQKPMRQQQQMQQPMQQNHQNMNHQQMQHQKQMQQPGMQQNQMNTRMPQQSHQPMQQAQQQNMNGPPQQQQQMRIQQQPQEMQPVLMNGGGPQQQQQPQQVQRHVQDNQNQQNLQPRQQQIMRGSMQNSPQNVTMRPSPHQQQRHQPQMQQPVHQQQQQLQQPMQQPMNQVQQSPQMMLNQQQHQDVQYQNDQYQDGYQQDVHHQDQPPVLQQQTQQDIILDDNQPSQSMGGNPVTDKTLIFNGESAILAGQTYSAVAQETHLGSHSSNQYTQSNQQGQSNQQQQGAPYRQNQNNMGQQNQNMQQGGRQQNQMPMQQSNMQQNQQNQQNPPVLQPQQPAHPPPKKRYRGKKNVPILETGVIQADTPVSEALKLMPSEMLQQTIPRICTPPVRTNRKINPPALTPVIALTPPQCQQNVQGSSQMGNRSGNDHSQNQMMEPVKPMRPVGNSQQRMNAPLKNGMRNAPQRRGNNQRVNGAVQQRGPRRISQPASFKPAGNKDNFTQIREAIVLHIKGMRKMTPEYKKFVMDELGRVMVEMEQLHLVSDKRYLAVQKLLVMVNDDPNVNMSEPEILDPNRFKFTAPVETEVEPDPENESPEDRAQRYDGYREMLLNAYPEKSWDGVNFPVLDQESINKEKAFYRREDMKSREAYLRKNIDNFPKEKAVKAKIEYLGLSLVDLQAKIRKEVMAQTAYVAPKEFLINPYSIRRTKAEYMQELKQYPDRATLEKKRKSTNYAYLQSVIKHSREFKEFHKKTLTHHRKVHKSMQQYISNEAKRVAREEMKTEKLRIQKLIQEDEAGYRAMLDDKKDQRLVYLLEQTDEYIQSLCELLKQQQETTSGGSAVKVHQTKEFDGHVEGEKVKSILDKARNDDDEYEKTKLNIEDYYSTAHGVREEIKEQHTLMGGGNPNLKLKPYQLKGLEWMVSLYNNNLNGILADEMGLGKTIQTIAFITYMMQVKKASGPFLVIVPLSTVPNWQNEFDKWAPSVHLIVYKGNKENRKLHEPIIKSAKFNVLLTTFEYVIREKALLGKLKWKYMMIDEGHRLKNQHCKLTEMLNTRFQCQRRLLITGTPLQNKLPELWALLNFLLPSIFQSCASFEQWFNAPFQTSGEKVELTSEETMLIIRRLHKVLRPFLLRRLKKEVESELPDKMEFVIKCEMSALQKMLYKHMQKGLLLDGKTNTGSRSLMNTMVHLRKLCNHPFLFQNVEDSCKSFWRTSFISAVDLYRVSGKLELLDRILPKLQATGHRVLMFFQMTSMMTIVEDYLAGGNINYLRLDGSTKPDERGALLDKFNAPNSEYFLFMLSTRAGGLGLNLQTADTVIIFDSDWNPHQDMQAQDRAHRIGQKAEVRVFRLITANSVEEKILASARFKLNVDEKVIQAGKFDNRSTGAERRQMLEEIIKADNDLTEDEDIPTDEEINDMISRSEDEFDIFQKMDQQRKDIDKRSRYKPRLCGDDEIPIDILRAADETDYIEKAKAEGRDAYYEVVPGSRRARKEVDYSTDTMSDEKFLEKLFDDEVSESPSKPSTSDQSSSEKKKDDAVFAVPKLPQPEFKVPKLMAKHGDSAKRKQRKSEGDLHDHTSKRSRLAEEEEKQKEDKHSLKRKSDQSADAGRFVQSVLEKPVERPVEQIITIVDDDNDDDEIVCVAEISTIERVETTSVEKEKKAEEGKTKPMETEQLLNEETSTPKKKKKRDHDEYGSSEKKKKKHREHDEEGSGERKKKHKRRHHENDIDDMHSSPFKMPLDVTTPTKAHKEKDESTPKKSGEKDDGSPIKPIKLRFNASSLSPAVPSSSLSKPSPSETPQEHPPLKIKFKMPSAEVPKDPETTPSSASEEKPRLSIKFKMPPMTPQKTDVSATSTTNSEPRLTLKLKIPPSPEKPATADAPVGTSLPKIKFKILPPKEQDSAPPSTEIKEVKSDADKESAERKSKQKKRKSDKEHKKSEVVPSAESETPKLKLKFKVPMMPSLTPIEVSPSQVSISEQELRSTPKSPVAIEPSSSEPPKESPEQKLKIRFKMPMMETPKPPAEDKPLPKLKFKMPILTSETPVEEKKDEPKLTMKFKMPSSENVSDAAASSAPIESEPKPLKLKFKKGSLLTDVTKSTEDVNAAANATGTPTKHAVSQPTTSNSEPPLTLRFKMPSEATPEANVAADAAPNTLPKLKFKMPSSTAQDANVAAAENKLPTLKFKMPSAAASASNFVTAAAENALPRMTFKMPSFSAPDASIDATAAESKLPKMTFKMPSVAAPERDIIAAAAENVLPKMTFKMPSFSAPDASIDATAAENTLPKMTFKMPSSTASDANPVAAAAENILPTLKFKMPTAPTTETPAQLRFKMPSSDLPIVGGSGVSEEKKEKKHKEHKRKSHEGETEEERRARKEAKRLRKEQEGNKDEETRMKEKAAKKAAKKELKRLQKEQQKAEVSPIVPI